MRKKVMKRSYRRKGKITEEDEDEKNEQDELEKHEEEKLLKIRIYNNEKE